MRSDPTFVAYIDESGDEGFRFDGGSSRWFVLSAVVMRKTHEAAMIDLVRDVRTLLGKPPKKPLHFRDLRHEHRLPFLDRIAGAELSAISILTHKPSLTEPAKFRGGSRFITIICVICLNASVGFAVTLDARKTLAMGA